MQNVLSMLKDVVEAPEFRFVGNEIREKVRAVLDHGVDCILKSQIKVKGTLTGWCQQHDPVSYEPRPGRRHEPVAIASAETVTIVRLLMSLKNKSAEITRAIDAPVEWLRKGRLNGVRIVRTDDDANVWPNVPGAYCWARFYEIETNRPVFRGRDGVIKYSLSGINREYRTRYAWYGMWGDALLK